MPVRGKFTQEKVSEIACAAPDHVPQTLEAAHAYASGNRLPALERSEILQKTADELAACREELIDAIVLDTSFTRKDMEEKLVTLAANP